MLSGRPSELKQAKRLFFDSPPSVLGLELSFLSSGVQNSVTACRHKRTGATTRLLPRSLQATALWYRELHCFGESSLFSSSDLGEGQIVSMVICC